MGKKHTNRGEVARYVVLLFLAHLVHSKVTHKAFLRNGVDKAALCTPLYTFVSSLKPPRRSEFFERTCIYTE
jgi:hypothetical protein